MTGSLRVRLRCAALLVAIAALHALPEARAEYGDIVFNTTSEKEGVRPVIFSHWFHRIRYRCKVCHSQIGFQMRAGADRVLMADLTDGRFCGACHNGRIAWAVDRCDLCHSGREGLKTGVYGGDRTLGPGRW